MITDLKGWALAGPPEWDLSDPRYVDLGDNSCIAERVRIQFTKDLYLATLWLRAGDPSPIEADPNTDLEAAHVWIEELSLRHQHSPGVQTQGVRSLPLPAMRALAVERARVGMPVAAAPGPPTRRRWAELTPDLLAQVALIYIEALEDGVSTTRAVAQRWSRTDNTATKWISIARAEGMLTKTAPGKRGGQLTAKAKRILEQHEADKGDGS